MTVCASPGLEPSVLYVLAGSVGREKLDWTGCSSGVLVELSSCSAYVRSPKPALGDEDCVLNLLLHLSCLLYLLHELGKLVSPMGPVASHLMMLGETFSRVRLSGPSVLSSLDFLEFFWTDLESQCMSLHADENSVRVRGPRCISVSGFKGKNCVDWSVCKMAQSGGAAEDSMPGEAWFTDPSDDDLTSVFSNP